jgi:hypothetical protein
VGASVHSSAIHCLQNVGLLPRKLPQQASQVQPFMS